MPHSDPALFSSSTRVSWSQIRDKPGWVQNLSGGGDVPLYVDMSQGNVHNVADPVSAGDGVPRSYIQNELLSDFYNKAAVDTKLTQNETASKAYTDAAAAAYNNPEWGNVQQKPTWLAQVGLHTVGEGADAVDTTRFLTPLHVNGGRIMAVAGPTTATDAANKAYVDQTAEDIIDGTRDLLQDELGGLTVPWTNIESKPEWLAYTGGTSEETFLLNPLSMQDNKITGLAQPTSLNDAATKKYVDDGMATKASIATETLLTLKADKLEVDVDIASAKVEMRGYTDTKFDGVNTQWDGISDKPGWTDALTSANEADDALAELPDFVRLKAPLYLSTHGIHNVASPIEDTDVATKGYVDQISGAGAGITGLVYNETTDVIDVTKELKLNGSVALTGLADPIASADAATKAYVDAEVAGASGNITGIEYDSAADEVVISKDTDMSAKVLFNIADVPQTLPGGASKRGCVATYGELQRLALATIAKQFAFTFKQTVSPTTLTVDKACMVFRDRSTYALLDNVEIIDTYVHVDLFSFDPDSAEETMDLKTDNPTPIPPNTGSEHIVSMRPLFDGSTKTHRWIQQDSTNKLTLDISHMDTSRKNFAMYAPSVWVRTTDDDSVSLVTEVETTYKIFLEPIMVNLESAIYMNGSKLPP